MEALKIIENHSYSFLDDYSKKIKDSVQNIKQNEPYFVFDNYHVMDDIDIEAFKEYFGLNCSLGDNFRCVFYKL